MKPPLLTICLLTHNSEKYLKKIQKSILEQTYLNFEILISDNQSTDGTIKIIEEFQKQNSKIFFRKNILDLKPEKFYDGCYSNCNGCLNSGLINGEFVSFWHQDDVYKKDIAQKEAEFLMNNPNVGAVFTLGNIINENDKIIGKYKLPKELEGRNTYNFTDIFRAVLKHGNTFLITPTFMVRKEVLNKIGLFHYEDIFKTSADLEMWLRIAKNYHIGILKEKLINWRAGGGGKKMQRLNTEQADFFRVTDYYLKKIENPSEIDDKLLRQYGYQKDFNDTLIAMNFLIKGNEKEAKKITNSSFKWKFFRAFFENMSVLRTKILTLKIILFIGINIGLGKPLGKVLNKIL